MTEPLDNTKMVAFLRRYSENRWNQFWLSHELEPYDVDEVIMRLVDLLYASDTEIQDLAIQVLVKIAPQRSVPFLIPLLKAQEDYLREYVCIILGDIGDWQSVTHLIDVLQTDESDNARFNAAVALGRIGDPRALPALQYSIEHDNGVNYENDAVSSMAEAAVHLTLSGQH